MSKTIREIAELAGVSPASVSLVLNGKKGVSAETRDRVKSVLELNNYSPMKVSSKKQKGSILFVKHSTHGMVVEENQGFIASIIDTVESECKRHSHGFVLSSCDNSSLERTLETAEKERMRGVILLGTELAASFAPLIGAFRAPLVVVDNNMQGYGIDSVVMANEWIMRSAVEHLSALGYGEIGYFRANVGIANFTERHAGYVRAMEELRLKAAPSVPLTPTLEGAREDMKRLLASGAYAPRGAVVADNDTIAIGASKALQEAGYGIPRDLSVIGVDDIPFSSMMTPPLTTMRISRAAIGVLAVKMLLLRVENPDWPPMNMQVSGQLIERGSVTNAKK